MANQMTKQIRTRIKLQVRIVESQVTSVIYSALTLILRQYWTNRLTVGATADAPAHIARAEEQVVRVVRDIGTKRTTPVVAVRTRKVQV